MWIELTEAVGARMWRSRALRKGAGHKYIRRVPKPGGGYRYYYKTSGVTRSVKDDLKPGAKFKLTHEGQAGHFEVVSRSGSRVTLRHDESGGTMQVSAKDLSDLLHREHAEVVQARKASLERDIAAAKKYGTAKQVARLEAQAQDHGFKPRRWTKKDAREAHHALRLAQRYNDAPPGSEAKWAADALRGTAEALEAKAERRAGAEVRRDLLADAARHREIAQRVELGGMPPDPDAKVPSRPPRQAPKPTTATAAAAVKPPLEPQVAAPAVDPEFKAEVERFLDRVESMSPATKERTLARLRDGLVPRGYSKDSATAVAALSWLDELGGELSESRQQSLRWNLAASEAGSRPMFDWFRALSDQDIRKIAPAVESPTIRAMLEAEAGRRGMADA